MAEKSDRKPSRPRKRQWHRPQVKTGQLFESNSLACGKTHPDVERVQCQQMPSAVVSPRSTKAAEDELLLAIGGVVAHLELEGAQPTFLEQLRARYGAFEMPVRAVGRARHLAAPHAHVGGSAAGGGPAGARPKAHPLTVTATGRGHHRRALGLLAEADRRERQPGARASATAAAARCEMNPSRVDCMLRVLYATILPRVGGMLIHSCGLRHAEVGVVFPGRSGAGKTTLARKAPDADDVLSDELVAVRRADDGGWRVHGTPVLGRLRARRHLDAQLAAAHARVPGPGAARRRHDDADRVVRVDAAPARLLPVVRDRSRDGRAQPGARGAAVRGGPLASRRA